MYLLTVGERECSAHENFDPYLPDVVAVAELHISVCVVRGVVWGEEPAWMGAITSRYPPDEPRAVDLVLPVMDTLPAYCFW